jgi:hypothetical protein
MNTSTLILAALLTATLIALAVDHRAGRKRTDAALARANQERAEKMAAFRAVDQTMRRVGQIANMPPRPDLPVRVPGQHHRRGAA